MFTLAKGHIKISLALSTSIPIIFFYSLLYTWLLVLLPVNLILLAGHVYFFRDPPRKVIGKTNDLLAPADGKVYEVLPDDGIIRIRMTLFDVHVNRWPISGRVSSISQQKGKHWPFFPFLQRGTTENAKQTIEVTNEIGTFHIVQIVGMIARRCVVYAQKGESIQQGERLGMIRYGSEVDIHFPKDNYEICVDKDNNTKAGVTVIAEYQEG